MIEPQDMPNDQGVTPREIALMEAAVLKDDEASEIEEMETLELMKEDGIATLERSFFYFGAPVPLTPAARIANKRRAIQRQPREVGLEIEPPSSQFLMPDKFTQLVT